MFKITDVNAYRAWNKSGTVINQLTGEPRPFTRERADAFLRLSHYTGKIVQL